MNKASEKPDTTFRFSVVEERGDEVIIEVSPEDYAREMAAGVPPEETLGPGRHKFIRGGFRKRYPNFDPATAHTTVHINLGLDYEVLEFFKQKARETNADSYQTVIRQALQRAMEQEQQAKTAETNNPGAILLGDPQFIAAVAERVKQAISPKATRKKTVQTDKRRRAA